MNLNKNRFSNFQKGLMLVQMWGWWWGKSPAQTNADSVLSIARKRLASVDAVAPFDGEGSKRRKLKDITIVPDTKVFAPSPVAPPAPPHHLNAALFPCLRAFGQGSLTCRPFGRWWTSGRRWVVAYLQPRSPPTPLLV